MEKVDWSKPIHCPEDDAEYHYVGPSCMEGWHIIEKKQYGVVFVYTVDDCGYARGVIGLRVENVPKPKRTVSFEVTMVQYGGDVFAITHRPVIDGLKILARKTFTITEGEWDETV